MAGYAARTEVNSDRSRAEIESTLRRYGADSFVYAWRDDSALIGFSYARRRIRFVLPLPAQAEFASTPTGRKRTARAAREAHEQEVRRRWRALALVIKAKLEAVASGIVAFDDEFLAYVVLPDGSTVGERIGPALGNALAGGELPPLLPSGL